MSVPEGNDINPFIPNTGQRKKMYQEKICMYQIDFFL